MASDKDYLNYVLEQLSDLENITYRPMMGEYIIYYNGKIIGGIYDDRLLIKPIKSALEIIDSPVFELPYKGAGKMILIEDVNNKSFLTELFNAMNDELPAPGKKK